MDGVGLLGGLWVVLFRVGDDSKGFFVCSFQRNLISRQWTLFMVTMSTCSKFSNTPVPLTNYIKVIISS